MAAGRFENRLEGDLVADQIPMVDYLILDDEPHLVSNECAECGALFFDRRNACAACGKRQFE